VVNDSSIKSDVVGKLRELSTRNNIDIKPTTEIFYDLKISGDDFDELIEWVSMKFGTDFSSMTRGYVPGEAELFPLILRLFGKRPYKSITVQHLLSAIIQKHWQASKQ
jgi:hypothetical protein